jgi:protein phosphatase
MCASTHAVYRFTQPVVERLIGAALFRGNSFNARGNAACLDGRTALTSGYLMNEPLEAAERRKMLSSALGSDDFKPASATVRAEVGARSHRGRAFKENEDHYLVLRLTRSEETLYTSLISRDVSYRFDECAYAGVVADGVGGEGAGAIAARLAISSLAHLELRFGQWSMRVNPEIAAEIIDRSKWLYARSHEAVLRWYRSHQQVGRMAAALTGFYSAGTDLFVAHVGHSRCYLFRNGLLTQLTRDQTVRERLTSVPQPTRVEKALNDAEHLLTNAIGAGTTGPGAMVDHFRLEDDDTLLLCTNGLTDMMSDGEIADALASRRTPEEQCDLLVDISGANGGNDNVTVVLANYRVPAPDEPEGPLDAGDDVGN